MYKMNLFGCCLQKPQVDLTDRIAELKRYRDLLRERAQLRQQLDECLVAYRDELTIKNNQLRALIQKHGGHSATLPTGLTQQNRRLTQLETQVNLIPDLGNDDVTTLSVAEVRELNRRTENENCEIGSLIETMVTDLEAQHNMLTQRMTGMLEDTKTGSMSKGGC